MLALESNVGSSWELYKKLSPGELKSMTNNNFRNIIVTMISDYGENGPSYDELYDMTMERYQNEWYASPDQMNNDHWKFMTGIFS